MSDHFPDATKMVSDTPRTDGCLTEILDAYGYVNQGNCPQRWVNHSRELERELNAANDRIMLLEEAAISAIHEAIYGREDNALEIWRKAMEAKP